MSTDKIDYSKMSVKDLLKTSTRESLLEQTKGKIVKYSDFLEKAPAKRIPNMLKSLEQAKKDFDEKKLDLTFKIKGSFKTRFGFKLNREDVYTIENIDKLEEYMLTYFKEEAPLNSKDKEKLNQLYDLVKSKVKEVVENKNTEFKFDKALITISYSPVSQYFELNGKNGAKIDLSC